MGRRSRRNGAKNGALGARRAPAKAWTEIVKENESWEKYYKAQNIPGSDEEFAKMKKTFQDALPVTFRVTGTKNHAGEVAKFFKQQCDKVAGTAEKPPFALPWYPDGLAYQIDEPKKVVKKDPAYAPVQEFLVVENEVGNISRQEAVSMGPPLFMDVKPEHYVLDMCAAPGSKTAQLVEALHQTPDGSQPTGFVVANDADYKRSYMLVHQIKRLNSPSYVVVNHDAQLFPKIRLEENGPAIKYDRILCDVPCSGDGTFRKNLPIWKDWRVGNALGLHNIQLNILIRGIQLLKAGGRLVFSTCSLNPIEDESIVAAALKRFGDVVHTVDVSKEFPALKRHPGLTNWKVYNKKFEEVQKGSDADADIPETCFPPAADEVADLHLENCIRVYPQDQNTGGFFITVFEKSAEADKKRSREDESEDDASAGGAKKAKGEEGETKIVPSKKTKLPIDCIEEPFVFLDPHNAELEKCWKFYQISDEFHKDCCMVRNAAGEPLRTVYYSAPIIKKMIALNEDKLKLVYTGVRLFVSQKHDECPWRIQGDSVEIIRDYMPDTRQVACNMPAFKILLEEQYPSIEKLKQADADPAFAEGLAKLDEGSCFVKVVKDGDEQMLLPMWKGKVHLNLMVDKFQLAELLYRYFDVDKRHEQLQAAREKAAAKEKKQEEEYAAKAAAEAAENAEAEPKTE